MESENLTIVNNTAEERFEANVDGHLAIVQYRLAPGRIIFIHTEVPEALQGRGVANKLARRALEYARDQQLAVVPLCPFIASYIRRHPEYQPLVRSG